jgi:hypothetical protein
MTDDERIMLRNLVAATDAFMAMLSAGSGNTYYSGTRLRRTRRHEDA